jgi:hypothetical protein
MAAKTVEGYIEGLPGPQAEVVAALRALILEAAPEVKESVKWAQPVYEANGPFAFIKAFPRWVNFGFWRGGELADPHGLLHGEGDRMRHVKVAEVGDIRSEALQDFVRSAVALNRTLGDPTKRG